MKASRQTGKNEPKKLLSRSMRAWRRRGVLIVAALTPVLALSGCIGKLDSKPATQKAIQFTPASLNFGNVSVGKKVTQSVTIKNSGAATLNITAANLSGKGFTLSGITFPFSLLTGATANLSVSFSGASTGSASGNLTLETDSGAFSAPVGLLANAIPAGAQLSPNPATVGFGTVTTGTTASSSVIVTNAGGSDLNISMITVNGAEFGVSGITTPKTISSGQSATINVSFAPTSTGSASGSLSINSNDPQSPATIALTGTGTTSQVGRLTLNPGTLAFGNVTVGSNNTLTSTVTNSGQATVHISQVNGSGSGVTASGLAAGSTIAAGQSAALQVRYAPAATGALSGAITIVSDAATSPTTLSLTGAGVTNTPPSISITTPIAGSTVSGTVSVTASASASAGVSSVQFQVDGANVGVADTSSPYSYSWDTTKSTNASHSLTAIVTDTANNKATSASVTVTVKNAAADTTPPTVPTGVTATGVSSSQISLSWTASTDNVGVTIYKVFRAGAQIATSAATSYLDSGLAASTTYSYTVAAYDAAGNGSAQSSAASARTQAAGSSGSIPSTLGWFQIPNTQLSSACPNATAFPNIQGAEGCAAVINDWSGGIADTLRNRLVMWGGGHNGYGGNELYSLNLSDLTLTRLNNPSATPANSCVSANPDGTPNSRHTYGGMAYIPTTDQLFAFNGSLFCDTGNTPQPPDSWTNNMATLTWNSVNYSGNPPGIAGGTLYNYLQLGDAADYDPNTKLVFAKDGDGVFSFNPATNVWTKLSTLLMDYHMAAVVDPTRKLFIMFGGTAASGGGILVVNIAAGSSYTIQDWNSKVTGCSALTDTVYPGLAYDTVQNLIVGWTGGDSVTTFNPDTALCSTVTYPGGPGTPPAAGTNGRFRYFPALGVFAVVNGWQENAYTLRLTPATGGSGVGPAISGISVSGIAMTGASVIWTTDVPATSQVEYGTTTSYGSMTTLNASLVASHAVTLNSLAANTAYHYRVHSKNSSGVESISGDSVFSTNNTTDTIPPTVAIITPVANSTVSGSVTVSASASDNVGVVRVQFLLDGTNLGAVLTASPYSLNWDTTTASNGAHSISAQAFDAAGNVGNTAGVSVTVSNSTSTTTVPFATRCAAAGVVTCVGFESATEVSQYILTNGVTGASIAFDPTVPNAEGNGAAKFTVPANTTCSGIGCAQGLGGSLSIPFGAGSFGQNSDLYFQYRQRWDSNYLSQNFGGEGWKQSIVHMHNQSCASLEVTLNNQNYRGYAQGYTDCGAVGLCISNASGAGCAQTSPQVPANDFLYEQGASLTDVNYNCYRNLTPNHTLPNCGIYQANQWETFYCHLHVGTWGSANSEVFCWVAYEGQSFNQYINITSLTLNFNNGPSDTFDTIDLLNYDTHATGTNNPQTSTWYDSLIISSQPIPAPNGPTPQ